MSGSAVAAHEAHGDDVSGGCPGEGAVAAGGTTAVFTICVGSGTTNGRQLQISPLGRVTQTQITCE